MPANGTGLASASSGAETQWHMFELIIHPQLNSLMLSHTFLIFLFPLVISLFHFSTPQTRRRPIFILNLAAIFLAFVVGVMLDVMSIHTIVDPLNPLPLSYTITLGCIGVWQSILVDLILLVRLVAVYPPRSVGLIRFTLLITIPVSLKIARVINILLFTVAVAEAAKGPNPTIMTTIVFITKPYLRIEWGTQMTDNTYVSLAFLWAIRDLGDKRIVTSSSNGTVTVTQRMRTLFRIALTNFVLPTMFSIAQFVSVYRGVSITILNQLVLVNIMLATFGVAFATVWAGKINREETQRYNSKRENTTNRQTPTIILQGHYNTVTSHEISWITWCKETSVGLSVLSTFVVCWCGAYFPLSFVACQRAVVDTNSLCLGQWI